MKPVPAEQITRRALWIAPLGLGAAAVVAVHLRNRRTASLPAAATDTGADRDVTIAEFDESGTRLGLVRTPRVVHTQSEWRELLAPRQYLVTRQGHTDPPFSGTYYRSHARGLFRCVCCGEALFSSDDKYDSGTGWPSFRAPAAMENVRTRREAGIILAIGIEVICARCGAHLGHVFDDGPPPAHLRYCIYESALRFVPHTGG